MSKIEVNEIVPQSGTTLTLGGSGDTLSIASGVTSSFPSLTVSGDLTVDTNTLYVNSSNNKVGIGTTSPQGVLTLTKGTLSGQTAATDTNDLVLDGTTSVGASFLTSNTGNGRIRFGDTDSTSSGLILYHHGSDYFRFDTAGSEAMRIASSGNVTIGTTNSTNLAVSAEDGIALGNSGFGVFSRASNTPLYIQRRTNDGDLISFTKDGTTVGSIGSEASGADLYISSSAGAGIYFGGGSGSGSVAPTTDGSTRVDNVVDLGNSSFRWNDLWLGGNIYLGGTGSANALDDYEEGTWTPTISGLTLGLNSCTYIKIGSLVVANFSLQYTSGTGTANAIGGLPFTVFNPGIARQGGFAVNIGQSIQTNGSAVMMEVQQGGTTIYCYSMNNNSSFGQFDFGTFNSGDFFHGTVIYQAA